MTGYKAIIKNMVDLKVTRFVEQKSGKFISVDKIELTTDNGIDSPTFNVSFSLMNDIMRHEYTLHGYIGDYGDVNITSCSFTRKIRKDGETEFKTVSEFLIREELDSFTFDR